jgi:hypothetical protein
MNAQLLDLLPAGSVSYRAGYKHDYRIISRQV